MVDPLEADEIASELDTITFGRHVITYDTIGSTNSEAAALAAQGAEEGTLVLAETQTEGRGRLSRPWYSPPFVNLYFSVILRPRIPPSQASMLTLTAGVALAEAIRQQTDLPAGLKWPNDVLIRSKKIGGILADLTADRLKIKHLILGIGLNVNLEAGLLPSEISETASSLMIEFGRAVSRLEMLKTVVNQLERWYTLFLNRGPGPIIEKYSGLSNTIGRKIRVTYQDRMLEGEAVGLAENGGLVVRGRDGITSTVLAGDVVHLR